MLVLNRRVGEKIIYRIADEAVEVSVMSVSRRGARLRFESVLTSHSLTVEARTDERLVYRIGELPIEVMIVEVIGTHARIGSNAPLSVTIVRQEIADMPAPPRAA